MNRNEQDKIQKRMKAQSIYRKTKQQHLEEHENSDVSKIVKIIVNIFVGLGILAVLLNALLKEF